jgi:hypothetical protein
MNFHRFYTDAFRAVQRCSFNPAHGRADIRSGNDGVAPEYAGRLVPADSHAPVFRIARSNHVADGAAVAGRAQSGHCTVSTCCPSHFPALPFYPTSPPCKPSPIQRAGWWHRIRGLSLAHCVPTLRPRRLVTVSRAVSFFVWSASSRISRLGDSPAPTGRHKVHPACNRTSTETKSGAAGAREAQPAIHQTASA